MLPITIYVDLEDRPLNQKIIVVQTIIFRRPLPITEGARADPNGFRGPS
jgi:hypothetical protein